MREIVGSVEGEYRRYKTLGEGAMEQLSDEQLSRALSSGGNSIATLVWHISGNLASRFADFLQSDGEKLRGGQWRYLTIPPGGSAAYSQNPSGEKPPGPSR